MGVVLRGRRSGWTVTCSTFTDISYLMYEFIVIHTISSDQLGAFWGKGISSSIMYIFEQSECFEYCFHVALRHLFEW